MITVKVTLKSASPISFSKHYDEDDIPRGEKESAADYEKRTWRNKCHLDKDGMVFIPARAFKEMMSNAAKYLSIKIQGKGKQTYTKHFVAGLMVIDNVPLGVHIDDVQGEWLFVALPGKKSSRVKKCFPIIPEWQAVVTFYILDETITKEIFREHLEQAGKFIGLLRSRPQNNGYYGRFEIIDLQWDVKN